MDRLKRLIARKNFDSPIYLHSNMDRLKRGSNAAHAAGDQNLHSNMDRLKPAAFKTLSTQLLIYIPIWID